MQGSHRVGENWYFRARDSFPIDARTIIMSRSTGLVLARNSILNLVTQGVVSVVAFISLPFVVHGMGVESFGILTLVWMVVGYFSVLDLGVGQASVKYLAEHLARDEREQANSLIWVSVSLSVAIGVAMTVALLLLVPTLEEHVFTIPASLQADAHRALYLVAFIIPFVMIQGAFRAVPMAVQRFDLFNVMLAGSGIAQWGGSFILVKLGFGLYAVVLLTVAIRVLGALLAFGIAVYLFPGLSLRFPKGFRHTSNKLLRFGSWLTVSQLVSPVTKYLDRVLVASYQTMRMFTFYAVPYEAVSRLQIIPMSISTTLFPAIAERVMKFLVVGMLPVSLFLWVFSHEILQLWLGGDFPIMSNTVLKILAGAVFVQALGYVPLTTLQAIGRPDIAAKYYLAEIPLYFALCFLLVPRYGIEGAAWAWLLRLAIVTTGLMWSARRELQGGQSVEGISLLRRSLGMNFLFGGSLFLLHASGLSTTNSAGLLVVASLLYSGGVWFYGLSTDDKRIILRLVGRTA